MGKNSRSWLLFVFMCSGAAGLIYQVVWTRELVLVFGNTSQAVTTIVSAFMAGLGFGGLFGGKLADRTSRPLRLYAGIEVLLAVIAALMPVIFLSLGAVYGHWYTTLSQHSTALGFIRFLLTFVAIAPATFLMGMTLPAITRFFARGSKNISTEFGALYAANTAGAMFGTIAGGFFLIEFVGLRHSSYIAVVLNLLAGTTALIIDRRQEQFRADASDEVEKRVRSDFPRRPILVASFSAGFVALALEVFWNRMLSEGTGSTIYIFVEILAVFLLGIAVGSEIFRRNSVKQFNSPWLLGAILAAIGILAQTTVFVGSGDLVSFGVGVLIVILPSTILMGYSFPLAADLLIRNEQTTGRSVGNLYAVNTMGSILGAFFAGFVFAPALGTNRSVLILGAVNVLIGLRLVDLDKGRPNKVWKAAPAVAIVSVVAVVCSGFNFSFTRTKTQNEIAASGLPSEHAEDQLATVDAVGGPEATRLLYVGGVGMTTLTVDTKLMAYVSHAMRPKSRNFLVIAFGMGGTYRAGLIDKLHTDAVELSPTVPSKMHVFFPDANRFLKNKNGKVIISDGRNYVRLSKKKYDMIAVDPAPPLASAGSVVLYTKEFIQESKHRLNPGGTMMLWLPYDAPLSDFKTHFRTFRAQFRDTRFMLGGAGVYMFGSDKPLKLSRAKLIAELNHPGVLDDLTDTPDSDARSVEGWVDSILKREWLENEQIDNFVGRGPIITDDHPRPEYYFWRRYFMNDNHLVTQSQLRTLAK